MDPKIITQTFTMLCLYIVYYDDNAVLVGIIIAQLYIIGSLLYKNIE
jgi:hypothetical protein